jgi:NitT/TauT family transport system permease protein
MEKKEYPRAKFLQLSFLSVTIIFLGWYIVTAVGYIRPIFLPSPTATAKALWELLASGIFFKAFLVSFTRIVIATIFASVVGVVLGLSMGISKKAESFFNPITQPLRYLPITAIIPLLIVWFGIGEMMKVVFLFLGIVCYLIPLVRNAVHSTPREYLDVAASFGAKFKTLVIHVYWPHALPQIFDGIIVANSIGWNYVILAEIINAREGLGYLIHLAGRLSRSDEVFAGLILIAAVAIGSDYILRQIRNKYFFW